MEISSTSTAGRSIKKKRAGATITPEPESREDDFEEGGWIGWLAVAGAFLVQFCGFGFSTSFGVYQDFYTRIYITNETASTIAWIGSTNACLVSLCGLLSGRLYDRGYFYHLCYGGTFLIAVSLFSLSFVKPNHFYQAFLTHGLGFGLGAGMMYIPSLAIISHHFRQRRAMAMSVVASGSSFGAFIHPIILNNTLNGPLGFANATRLQASIITALLLIACLMMKTKPQISSTPTPALSVCIRKFVKDTAYIAGIVGSMLFLLGYYYPIFYLQLDAVSHGLSKDFAFYALVILSVAGFVGRLATGVFVRHFDVDKMAIVTTLACAAMIFAMAALKTAASVIVIAIIFGFFAGMYISLLAPLFALLSDDISELGMRMGVGISFGGLGVLVGPPIHGALLGSEYSWWKSAVFSGAVSLVGCAFFVAMTVLLHYRRRRRTEVVIDIEKLPPSKTDLAEDAKS